MEAILHRLVRARSYRAQADRIRKLVVVEKDFGIEACRDVKCEMHEMEWLVLG